MVKLAVRVITTAFALVGLGTIVAWIWPLLRGAPLAANNLTVVTSPDGKFKAALLSWDGGGGIAPYCYDSVFVVPVTVPTDLVADEKNLVFAGECASFADNSTSPKLSWSAPRSLVVKFSTSRTALLPAAIRLRGLAADGQLKVEFEVDH